MKLNEIKEYYKKGDFLTRADLELEVVKEVFAVRCFLSGLCDLQLKVPNL